MHVIKSKCSSIDYLYNAACSIVQADSRSKQLVRYTVKNILLDLPISHNYDSNTNQSIELINRRCAD